MSQLLITPHTPHFPEPHQQTNSLDALNTKRNTPYIHIYRLHIMEEALMMMMFTIMLMMFTIMMMFTTMLMMMKRDVS